MKKLLTALILWLIFITPLSADDSLKFDETFFKALDIAPVFVNLRDCLDIALENNYEIKKEGIQTKIAKKEYQGALTEFLPNFSYDYTVAKADGEFLVGDILFRTVHERPYYNDFKVTWDVTDGGRVFFNAASKKNLLKARVHYYNYTKDETILKTTEAYYILLQSKLSLEILLQNVKERNFQLKLANVAFKAGVGTKFDVIRSESELSQAEQNYLIGVQKFRLNQAQLANVMGVDVFSPLVPAENDVETHQLVNENVGLEEVYETALSMREDVKALKKEIASLKNQKNSLYSEFIPKVYAEYQKQFLGSLYAGDTRSNHYIALRVSVPLGRRLGLESAVDIQKYIEMIRAKEVELEILKRKIKENIVNSVYESKTAKDRIKPSDLKVNSTSESVRLAELRFKAGEGILLDIIQAQTIKTQARIELVETLVDYNIAQAQILFDAGIITKEEVLKNYTTPSP